MINFPTFVDELQLITGIDIPIEGLGLTIRQPKVREIAMLGEQNYFVALQIFRMTKQSLHIESPEVTNWMILQESMKQKIDGVKNTRQLVTNFLQLFFNEKVMFGPRSIIVQQEGEMVNIEPEDFDGLQEIIGQIGGSSLLSPPEETFNPKNKRAAEIAEKMKKARKRLAEVKARENGTAEMANKGFLARYIRAVAIATPNSLEEVNAMTLLQLNSIMQTYLGWEAYDLEVKSRLAGAKNDKELVHWMMRTPGQENDSIGKI